VPFTCLPEFADSRLEGEADVFGVNPLSLGGFCVGIWRGRFTNELLPPQPSEVARNDILEARKIDQESFKKHGIAFGIGYGFQMWLNCKIVNSNGLD
jgi:hypothetical protein